MKTLLILLVIFYVRGDKWNKLYLPPIGANYSGGLSGDIEVPFKVPVQIYFGTGDTSKIITEQQPDKSFNALGSTTHAPTGLSYDARYMVPVSGGNTATKDVSSTPTNVNENLNQNQLFVYNNAEPIPITNDKNDIANIDSAPEISIPSNSNSGVGNIKSQNRISPIGNQQYVPNFDYYTASVERVLRPHAEADGNSIVLNDKNEITPDRFSYSYDTSNGIHADESGTATNGVRAHGSYSYIGDDGELYNVTYTADENGFRPSADHLPTPPPIPEAILKVIEQAAIDKSNGIFDDGSYDENKYGYKKYENPLDKFSNSISSTRRFNSNSNKPKNIKHANIGTSRIENYISTSTTSSYYTDDGKNHNLNMEPASNGQDSDDYENRGAVNFNKEQNHNKNHKESELENAFNGDLYRQDFPNIRQENEWGYQYMSPKNKFVLRNNTIPESSNDIANKDPPMYVYDKTYTPESDKTQNLFVARPLNTIYGLDLDKNKDFIDLTPNPVTDDEYVSVKIPDIYQFGQRKPSRPPTDSFSPYTSTTLTPFYLPQDSTKALVTNEVSLPTSTERIIPVGTYIDQQSNFFGPSSSERIKQIDVHTERPSNLYGPSPSERIKQLDVNTQRPISFYEPSYTENTKQLDTHTNRPTNYYEPLSSERIKDHDSHTERPSNFNGPSPTAIMNLHGTYYIDRPRYFNGLPTTDNIKEVGTYANRTDELDGPLSTERIIPINTYSGPGDFHGPLSTERIKPIGTYTDGPNEFYGPSSTERIIGENFAGPKQPQSYNTQTGYHY